MDKNQIRQAISTVFADHSIDELDGIEFSSEYWNDDIEESEITDSQIDAIADEGDILLQDAITLAELSKEGEFLLNLEGSNK